MSFLFSRFDQAFVVLVHWSTEYATLAKFLVAPRVMFLQSPFILPWFVWLPYVNLCMWCIDILWPGLASVSCFLLLLLFEQCKMQFDSPLKLEGSWVEGWRGRNALPQTFLLVISLLGALAGTLFQAYFPGVLICLPWFPCWMPWLLFQWFFWFWGRFFGVPCTPVFRALLSAIILW